MARFYLSLVLLGCLFPIMAQEQSLLSTAGGFYQNSEINVSWSLGETVTDTFGTGTYTLTQGFQQGKLEPVGITGPKNPFPAVIEVFPNPTNGLVYVMLKIGQTPQPDLPDHFTLFNIQGKQLAEGPIREGQSVLDLNGFSGAVYYLRFFNPESDIQKTVIIQKIN
jgi:hypothetical protein